MLLLGLGLGVIFIGIAIGSTGVGGVLLVPLLLYAVGLPVEGAIAAALWSYLWSGILAVLLYARRGSIPWRQALPLGIAAMPGAYLGAIATGRVPPLLLEALIAALLVLAGSSALRPLAEARQTRVLGTAALAALGAATGFGAALLGAGGAVLLVPALIALDQPALLAVGLGQAIQIPISALASLANLWAGRIDLELGSAIAAALALGIAAGVPLAHALPQRALRRLIGSVMALIGVGLLLRLIL